jgi:hypothetical protein
MKTKPKCYTRVKTYVLQCGREAVSVEGVSSRLELSQKGVQQCFVFMNREGLLSQAQKRPMPFSVWLEDLYYLRKKN